MSRHEASSLPKKSVGPTRQSVNRCWRSPRRPTGKSVPQNAPFFNRLPGLGEAAVARHATSTLRIQTGKYSAIQRCRATFVVIHLVTASRRKEKGPTSSNVDPFDSCACWRWVQRVHRSLLGDRIGGCNVKSNACAFRNGYLNSRSLMWSSVRPLVRVS